MPLFIVFIVFLVLKLAHVINWSWWLVTLPLWIGLVVSLVFGSIAVGVTTVYKRLLK